MKKKSIISIVLVLSIIASLFTISAISTSAAKLPAPTLYNIMQKPNGLGIKWSSVGGANGYALYVGNDNSKWQRWCFISASEYKTYYNKYGYFPLYKKTLIEKKWYLPGKTITTTMPKINIGKTHCFQVVTCNSSGGGVGKWSKVKSSVYMPSAPTLSGHLATSKGNINDEEGTHLRVAWSEVFRASGYEVVWFHYNNNRREVKEVIYDGPNTSFFMLDVGTFYFQVRAYYRENGITHYTNWSKKTKMMAYPKIILDTSMTMLYGSGVTGKPHTLDLYFSRPIYIPSTGLRAYLSNDKDFNKSIVYTDNSGNPIKITENNIYDLPKVKAPYKYIAFDYNDSFGNQVGKRSPFYSLKWSWRQY